MDLTLETFYNLVNEQVAEDNKTEFKVFSFPAGKVLADQKEKLQKEIAAFANAEGGTIYIGIDEGDNKVASQVVGVGCGSDKFDQIQLAIQGSLLAKVRPRIYGISMHKFDLSDKDMVIAITVPKSISRPHAVNDGNKDNFYIRHSNGVTNMSLDDLRREILSSASYQTEIKRFRQDRIAMIMSNEYIRNFEEGAKLVLHLIPLWSLDIGNAVDLNALDSWTSRNGFCPMSGGGYESIYCAEGRLSFSIPHNSNDVQSSMLVMRNGIIEVVDSRMMNYDRKHKEVYHWNELERIIYKKINDCGTLLEKLNAPRPWYISAAIVNGKEYRTSDAWNGQSECLHSNYIQSVDCLWNDEQSLNEIIQPCFDALANAFGYRKSGIDFASDKIK